MNERYTYGYNSGWNVENEYINSLDGLMNNYDNQIAKLEEIKKVIEDSKAQIEVNNNKKDVEISDDQIRVWYNEDYLLNGGSLSFEAYKRDILAQLEKNNSDNRKRLNEENQQLETEIISRQNEYVANLYYMTTVKDESRRVIFKRRNELELLLSEKNIQLSSILLGQQKNMPQTDEYGNVINKDKLDELRKTYDETWLEIRKIEHALQKLDEMFAMVEFTKEETDLMMRGLNPQQREKYDQLKKNKIGPEEPVVDPEEPIVDPEEPIVDPEEPVVDPEEPVVDPEEPVVDPEEPIVDPEEPVVDPNIQDIDDYNMALEVYKGLLNDYQYDLENLYNLQERLEREEIEYSEYAKFADYMVERYRKILHDYEIVKKLKAEKESYEGLTEEQLRQMIIKLDEEYNRIWHFYAHNGNGEVSLSSEDEIRLNEIAKEKERLEKLLANKKNSKYAQYTEEQLNQMLNKLEEDFNKIWHFYAHKGNGEVALSPEDEARIEAIRKQIEEIKKELERRKNVLEEPEKPMQPMMVGEKETELEEEIEPEKISKNIVDPRKILLILQGKDNKYGFSDNFALKYSNIKIFGWKKYKERTLLDKPIRLTKLGIGGVIKAPLKFFAKLTYLTKKKKLKNLQQMISMLTPEQLDALIDYGIAELKAFRPDEAIMTALLPRLCERINERLIINNNIMSKLRNQMIDLYVQAQNIYLRLESENLSVEERKGLELEFNNLSNQLYDIVLSIDDLKKSTDELVNPARLGDAFTISKNLRTGGFYSKNKVDFDVNAVDVVFGDRLEKAIKEGNGFAAAEALISRDKLDKENTIIKRTLRNKFGKTSVGSRYFSPFVEQEDYEKNPYFSNLMQTAVLAMTICNLANQMSLQKELDSYRNVINQQNQMIQNYQAKYAVLEQSALQSLDPVTQQNFANELRTLAETQAGYVQGICEDFAQKSAAGVLGAGSPIINSRLPEYHVLDEMAHNATGKFIGDIQNISTTLPPMDQIDKLNVILKDMNNFMVDFTAKSFPGVAKYMAGASGFDFTAQQTFAQSITQANPSLAVELEFKLLDLAQGIVDLPTLTTIQNLSANADVAGALTILCGVLGKEVVEDQFKQVLKGEKAVSNQQLTEEYSEKLDSVKTKEELMVEREYQRKLEEYDSRGKLYKWLHKNEMPTKTSVYRDVLEEQSDEVYERGLR